jgi:hypothetical protein
VDRLHRFFEVSARRSTIAAEVRGGLVYFARGWIESLIGL